MAVKSTCPQCGKGFSAPEDYLGKKIDCPRCGHRTVLRTPEEVRAEEEREVERLKGAEEDRERIALIERMEVRRRRTRPYYETFGIRESAVRHFNPSAPSRFLRFRALSEVLNFAAYIEALLVLIGMGLTVALELDGTIPSLSIMLLALVSWMIVGSLLFLGLKFLAELAFNLSDLGDQQNDLVQLLLDVRDNTDVEEPREQDEARR